MGWNEFHPPQPLLMCPKGVKAKFKIRKKQKRGYNIIIMSLLKPLKFHHLRKVLITIDILRTKID